MRVGDIAVHAATVLPRFTDLFTDTLTLASVTVAAGGGSATIETTTPHNLATANSVNFTGLGLINKITAFTQTGGRVTFTTEIPHDLTLGWTPHRTVQISGFTNTNLNRSFDLIAVPNRRQFVINTTETVGTLAGTEELTELNRVDGLFGVFSVASVVNETTFTVNAASDQPFAIATYVIGSGKIQSNPRIIPTASPRKAFEHYSKQLPDKFFMFVIPIDISASKDRNTFSDAIAERTTGSDQYQRIVDGFRCLIFAPVPDELTGSRALDTCRHDLLQAMSKTFTGVRFDAGTVAGVQPFRTVLFESGLEGPVDAYLVYRYTFQQSFDLTNADRFVPPTSAFRDIDVEVERGDNIATGDVNLDEEPFNAGP